CSALRWNNHGGSQLRLERTDGGSASSTFRVGRRFGGGFARALTRRIRLPVGSWNPSRRTRRQVLGVALQTLAASPSGHAAGKARWRDAGSPSGGKLFIYSPLVSSRFALLIGFHR